MDSELAATYDRIAKDWHRDHSSDDWWVAGTDKFVSYLPKGGRVLDAGCGSGVKSRYLLDHGLAVTGIDISNEMLRIARREAPGGDYRQLSMTDLDRLPEAFDGVFAQASLLHIPKAEAPRVVAKLVEHAGPGGLIYLAVKETRKDRPEEEMKREDDLGYEYERFFSYFTMPELGRYLTGSGVQILWQDATPSGKTVWLQIIGRK